MRWTPARTPPHILEDLIWAEVARAFAAGATGPELADKFGFGLSTFYAHAKAGGWQRKQIAAREQSQRLDPPAKAEPARDRVLEGLELRGETLEADAAELARRALARVAEGDGKGADAALKAADRLLRIRRKLGGEPETSKSQAALDRLTAMSDAELEAEILRLAGMG